MSWKKCLMAAGLGALAGYIIADQVQNQKSISPEKALKIAKQTFKQQGPISGSWIYMKPEEMEKGGLTYKVYRGGVTRTINGQATPYDFYVDADTGSIIDVTRSESA